MKTSSRQLLLLFLILILAGVLRFYNLSSADVITDEALIGFRSIGYIDFFVSPFQTTPFEWFSDIPKWASWSFHDHPPLIFAIQHLFFNLFGQSIFILRLPFVLFGIATVYLSYLLGKRLFNQQTGLIAALLLAVTSYHVWISRIGLQESAVIFFILLTLYLFIKNIEDSKHWQWGIAFGLAMLTKYTAIVLLPIFFGYILWSKKEVLKSKQFWLAILVALVIFSPVIFYNISLFQERGHFDLQLSYLLGQDVPDWEFLPGKVKAGDFSDKLQNLIPALYSGMLWPLFILFIISLGFGIYKNKLKNKNFNILLLAIILFLVLFLLIGPSKRFVVMIVPFVILLIAWFIAEQKKIIQYVLVSLLVVVELFFTFNTVLLHYPIGEEGVAYSHLKIESYNWGYSELNEYINKTLDNKYPEFTFVAKYEFLEDIKKNSLNRAEIKGYKPASILIIYDANMFDLATLWIFHRQLVYQGWPVVTADAYLEQGAEFWIKQGVQNFYFYKIKDTEILQQSEADKTQGAFNLASQLQDVSLEIIKRPDGREVFEVYNWQ